MDRLQAEPVPVRSVQSIRERFECSSNNNQMALPRRSPPVSPFQPGESEPESNHSGSSLSSHASSAESDQGSTGTGAGNGGFQSHNQSRTSIKRSPAFRTGHKDAAVSIAASDSGTNLKKTPLRRAGNQLSPEPIVTVVVTEGSIVSRNAIKKPSLKRKPGVTRTSKPNLETIISINGESPDRIEMMCDDKDPLIEEALKAPLPTGPAPRKPPRTFQHDAFIMGQQIERQRILVNSSTETETEASPQRPARRKSNLQRINRPSVPNVRIQQQQPNVNGAPYAMSRSKTEPSLFVRRKSNVDDEQQVPPRAEDSNAEEEMWSRQDTRWLNPVQWNHFTPSDPPASFAFPSSRLRKPATSPRLYSSMVTIAGPDQAKANNGPTRNSPMRKGSTGSAGANQPESGQYQVRRMSCDFFEKRRPSCLDLAPHSLPVVYDQPSTEGGDLHYMCSPVVEVADYNSWNVRRVISSHADDSDDSERDINKTSQMVEDRKIYVRRVSSNVCDLKRASRAPLTARQRQEFQQLNGAGLYEIFLEVALYYDRNSQRHTPYIKSCYPNQASVPSGVELFCFPDATYWPPPLQKAADPYTIVLTDSKGDRLYGYCRRIVPEGAQTCIPITYCLLSRHRAAGFFNKLLNLMVSRHGVSVAHRSALLECLHKQAFPNPGRFVELPVDQQTSPSGKNKVQRLLDGRLEDNDLRVLFERLNETVVLHVLGTILLERKLIFVSQNLATLSLCIDAVQSMLYPFVWQHTIVPALPHSMTEISSAPTPFILGLLSKNVDDWKAIQPDQGMLVDLDSGKVLHCVGDESTILPRRSVRKLMADWEVTVNITQQAESARNALYSESFLRMFVDVCGHYEQHIHSTDSGQKYFERAVFIRNHSNSGVRDFLEWFTETAMFNMFIESKLRQDSKQTLFEHKILEHSMQIVRPNAQLILPNSKVLGRKIKTIGDKLREMNVFS